MVQLHYHKARADRPESFQDISNLRNTFRRIELNAKKRGIRPLAKLVADKIFSFFSGLSLALAGRRHSMCQYYGHVIDKANWKSEFPACQDCGITIHSADQLRKAASKTPAAKPASKQENGESQRSAKTSSWSRVR